MSIPACTRTPESAVPEQQRRGLNQRRMRAFTSLFLAHSYRFRTGVEAAAVPLYEDALVYMGTMDDPVAVAWSTFEFADLQFELGNGAKARTLLHDAATIALAEDADDLELFANLHRLRADLDHAACAPLATVLSSQMRALQRAFVYLDEPRPPDPYTVVFYQEQRERFVERLCAGDPATVGSLLPALVEQLRLLAPVANADLLLPAVAARDATVLTDLLTPGPPDPGRRRADLSAAVAR